MGVSFNLSFKRNLSTADRIARAAIGAYLLLVVYTETMPAWGAFTVLFLGISLFLEAASGY